MNTWTMLTMQESNSPIYDMMLFFHDLTMTIIILIMMMISYIMYMLFFNYFTNRFLLHNHLIEMIWTISPILILIIIAMPSIKILYMMDEIYANKLTIKSIGHQWYWSYEYSDFKNINFDSFMIPPETLLPSEFRLLEVDNRCILPYNFPIRMMTTSMDVIHAWTVPSLGIKMDSTPGRLNQSMMFLYRPGLYFGQCSEICGINHSFMPIIIESTNINFFLKWMKMF